VRTKAPGLTFKLERRFSAAIIDELDRHYAAVEEAGGNEELGLTREEGVSFNPRIARVASLLLEERGKDVTANDIAAAMWSLVTKEASELVTLNPEVSDLVQLVRGDLLQASSHTRIAAIIGVRELDTIRHLHMTTRSLDEKRAYLNALKTSTLLAPSSAISQTLRKKVEHAVAMQERCLDADGSEGRVAEQ
jgi:hypothetical protein